MRVDKYGAAATLAAMTEPKRLVTEAELRKALEQSKGSVTDAAKVLGVHRVTVYKLMRRFGVEVRREVA